MPRPLLQALVRETDWRLNAVMAGTAFVLVGICAVTVGLLHDPLMTEFHWSNSAVSGLATAYSLACLLCGPVVGAAIDRSGSKRAMLVGSTLTALGFFGLPLANSQIAFYLAFTVIGIGYGGAFFLASTKIIVTRVKRHTNVGMGLWMFAGSIGAACFSSVISAAITALGWRNTALGAGLLILATVPAIAFFVPSARDDGDERTKADAPQALGDPSARKALLSSPFILMTLASMFAAFGMSAIYYHTTPIFISAGFSAASAGAILGASWILSAFGSLLCGALSDRISTRAVLAGSLLLGAAGSLALLLAPLKDYGAYAAYGFVLLWGATANAVNQFLPLLLADRFGAGHLGTLVGVQGAFMGLVGSFAPVVTGALFDHFASYQVSIIASVAATSTALLFVLAMPRRRRDATTTAPLRAAIHH